MSATELVKVGLKASLASAAIENGTWKFTSDSQELYFEHGNARFPISDIVTGNTEEQIEAITAANALPKIYVSSDTHKLFYYDGGWNVVGGDSVDFASSASADADGNIITETYETQSHASSMVTYLEGLINNINSFEIQVVDSVDDLPTDDPKSNILYFVPNTKSGSNVYDEYVWVVDDPTSVPKTGHYECIGTSALNFDDYYTKTESDAKFATTATTEDHASSISALEDRMSTAESDISDLQTVDGDHAASISALEDRMSTAEGDIDALEELVGQSDASSASTAAFGRIAALEQNLSDLEDDVDTIHRYNVVQVAELPQASEADPYTIYMVPDDNPITNDDYQQWVYVAEAFEYVKDGSTVTIDAGWQRIDSTSAFGNYYTKAEVDSMVGAATADIASVGTRVTEVEAKIGNMAASTAAGFKSIETRLSDEETATGEHASSISALETRAENLEVALGTSGSSTADSALGRIDVLEDDVDAIEEAINGPEGGSSADSILGRLDTDEAAIEALQGGSTALEGRVDNLEASTLSIASTVSANETAIGDLQAATADIASTVSDNTGRIADLEVALGTSGSSTESSALGRIDVLEDDVDDLEAALGTSADASSQATAFGRINKIDETIGTSTVSGAILPRLDALANQVAGINLFDIQIVDALPAVGEEFIIYFVADTPDPQGDLSTYKEYMWIPDENHQDGGYYEQIGITKANLDDYYTKEEADARFATTADGAGLGDRVTEVEAKLGAMAASTASGFKSVEARLTDEETATTNHASSISALEEALGTSGSSTESSALGRIDIIEGQIGSTADAGSIIYRITDLENADTATDSRIDALEELVGESDASSASTSAFGRIAALEDELDSHDFNYAGASSEGGAAIKVEETASTATADREVLIVNEDKDAVEYASDVKINPNTGTLTANALKLGDCTLSYDSNSQAVVFTYA